jgi:hypothetical protein
LFNPATGLELGLRRAVGDRHHRSTIESFYTCFCCCQPAYIVRVAQLRNQVPKWQFSPEPNGISLFNPATGFELGLRRAVGDRHHRSTIESFYTCFCCCQPAYIVRVAQLRNQVPKWQFSSEPNGGSLFNPATGLELGSHRALGDRHPRSTIESFYDTCLLLASRLHSKGCPATESSSEVAVLTRTERGQFVQSRYRV